MEDQGETPIAWFEFLLNPSLLEGHLLKKNCDPSPIDLIVNFIFNGMKKKEISANETGDNQDSTTQKVTEKMKHVLAILPLQTAAHLNWNLNLFQTELPLYIQDALLTLTLQETLEDHLSPVTHTALDTGPLLPHQLFSISLYHRYALSTIVNWKLPSKPIKMLNIPIPGQQDPMHESRENQESIVGGLERGAEVSMRILEQLLTAREVRSPTLSTFSTTPTNHNSDVKVKHSHLWDKCKLVPDEQFKFQIHYELGNYLFLLERFSDALHHFSEALQLLPELGPSPSFCNFSEDKLRGFYKSCLAICGRSTPVAKRNLYDRFIHSLSNDFEGLIEILTEDNIIKEIPFYLRLNLQLDLMAKQEMIPESLLFHVQTLNTVGDVLQGRCWDSMFTVHLLDAGRDGAQYLVQLLGSKLTHYTPTQKKQIRSFIETLALCPNQRELLVPQIMTCAPLASLFSHEEIVALWPGSEIKAGKSGSQNALDFTLGSSQENINDHIWNLLHSMDIRVIEKSFWSYINASPLKNGSPKRGVLALNTKWDGLIPMPVRNTLSKLTSDPSRDLVFLLVAKAQELALAKSFSLSLDLLNEAVTVVRKILPKDDLHLRPCKMIKWMIMAAKIQQQIFHLPCVDESVMRGLSMETKQCLSLLSNNRESVLPWTYIIHWSVLLLLNTQDWPSLTGGLHLPPNHFPIMHIIKPLANAAQALQSKTPNKKIFLELFNLVADIIVGSTSYKDQPVMTRSGLVEFVDCVREPFCLSLLISLLGHLYNSKIQDPSSSVHIDHQSVWPATYNDIDFMDKFSLRDILNSVVDHATGLYSSGSHSNTALCSSWHLTKGDLAYQKAHRKAIQNYLTAIFIATNYLRNDTNNSEQNAMSDVVIRRLISSCMSLDCYTQAAILCQFLETIDYNTAIGCLQERSAIDGMDAYYNCLFDVTLMEFIINIHQKKGEFQKRDRVLKIIGLLEINSNNNEEIQREAAKVRKHRFLRAMGKLYL